ncbi:glycoside hydrolase family 172 protein [Thermodesulfobacteriota bacterium]
MRREDAPKTLLMGHDCRRFYCYFPMPFRQEAVIVLENRRGVTVEVSWDVVVTVDSYSDRAGHFKAFYNEENPVAVGRDYRIGLRRDRAGKWVGLTHTMRGSHGRWYLEGDERYYVDGSATPALHGTGTEDYYNGGWYFLWGPFTEPLCGNPSHRTFPDYDQTGAYRLHVGDAVHYLDGARLGIEHGSDNSGTYDHYSSVAYYYELDTSLLQLSDTLDIGVEADESAHDYGAVDSEIVGELTSFYEGEDDEIPVTDAGRIVKGESRFRIDIDPENEGVVLRRRFDQFSPRQRARVLVDGMEVGTWYMPENSMFMRWAEDDFVLPPSSTSGRSNVEILIRPEGETDWTEFFYWLYSIVP